MPRAKQTDPGLEAFLSDESVPQEVRDIGRHSGSASMALAIVETDGGQWPSDAEAVSDFLVVNREMETKALKEYLRLSSTIGGKLAAAKMRYLGYKRRSDRLFGHLTGETNGVGAAS